MSDNSTEQPSTLRRNLLLLLLPAALSALTVLLIWHSQPDPDYWKGLFEQSVIFLEAHPWALFLAVATLPGVGFPISPLLFLFGIVLAPSLGMLLACLLGIVAQSICTIWTYLLSAGPLRDILRRFVGRRRALPDLTDSNAKRLCLILRITPGIPYALQNIVLGIMGMKLKPYLLVSIPITGLWTTGFILTGGALFDGQAGLAITGFLLLLVLVLVTKMLRSKNQLPDAG